MYWIFKVIIVILISQPRTQISEEDSKSTEICLECKDKVVKFYHFKRKTKEIQRQKLQSNRLRTSKKKKNSKVVQSIIDIVENYTEKYAISSVEVDEFGKKLTIVPAVKDDSVVSVTNSSSNFSFADALNVTVKQEPDSDFESSLLQSTSDLFDFSGDIVVKEEPTEQPAIYPLELPTSSNNFHVPSTNYEQNSNTPRRRSRRATTSDDKNSCSVSKAALKMRAYRERLKKPENFHRYLRHQQQQREWNKRHYEKKQIMTGKPVRQRRSRAAPVSYFEDYDEPKFAMIVDAN
jgi:hypothetical protein